MATSFPGRRASLLVPLRFLNHNCRLWGSEISLNDPYCPGHPRAGTFFFFCSSKEVSPLKPFGHRPRGRRPTANGVEIVEDGLRLKPKKRVRLVSVAGPRDMMLSERAAEVSPGLARDSQAPIH
jgi:hypothetical protein